MKPFTVSIIKLLAAVLVLAGVLVAGCTQDSGSTTSAAANSQQAVPAGTGSGPSSDNGGSNGGSYAGNGSYGNHQFGGSPNFLTNDTLMSAAAAQLGVSEQALQNALTPQSGQRINFTVAANQLNVTPAQLRAALGFQAGTFHHGNQTMAMMTPASGQ